MVIEIVQISQNEFTEMAWEGIVGAVDAARVSKQQVIESEHLMKALLEQKDGLARRIFTKAGLDNTSVLQATDDFIDKQPNVSGYFFVLIEPILMGLWKSLVFNLYICF